MPTAQSVEQARYTHSRYFPGLELLRARFIRHSFAPHYHETYALGIVEQGALSNSCTRIADPILAGETICIPPGKVHGGQSLTPGGVAYRMLYIPFDLINQMQSAAGANSAGLCFAIKSITPLTNLSPILSHTHQVLDDPVSSRLEQESALLHLIAIISNVPASTGTPARQEIRRVQEYLKTHFMEDVSLHDLADLANLSPFHLLRAFKRQVGLTPHAFLTQQRIEKAREYIRSGAPLSTIAADTGYFDQSHLIKAFKKFTGITPREYRGETVYPKDLTGSFSAHR